MSHKTTYDIYTQSGVNAHLHHSLVMMEQDGERYFGDDEIIFEIPDFAKFGNNLCSDGNIYLHLNKAEAKRLSRILWQLSARLMTAEQRELEDISDIPERELSREFMKEFEAWEKQKH